jgi:hypothetical protein
MRRGNAMRGMVLLSQAYFFEKKLLSLVNKLVLLSYQRVKAELLEALSLHKYV